MTDTDSLLYGIKTEDVYEDFSSDKEMFGFSKYATKSKYYDDSNKLVIAKMKDKASGVAIEEFVRLKPKMYSFFLVDNNEHKNQKVWIKMLSQQLIMNVRMFCWIESIWHIRWIGFKVKIMKYEIN